MYQVKSFVSYDDVNHEVLVAWDDGGESEEPQCTAQCAYDLYHDLGKTAFRRLCKDAAIGVALVIGSAGIVEGSAAEGSAEGVEVC